MFLIWEKGNEFDKAVIWASLSQHERQLFVRNDLANNMQSHFSAFVLNTCKKLIVIRQVTSLKVNPARVVNGQSDD